MMGGHEFEPAEDFQSISVIDDINPLPDIFLGKAIMMLVQRYEAVFHNCHRLPCLHLKARCRQRLKEISLHLVEQFPAGVLATCHLPIVEVLKRSADGFIQRVYIVEGLSFQVLIDRPV